MIDPFRPRREPHRTIYDSLLAESSKRAITPHWETSERENAWRTARDYAEQHGLRVPLMAEVEQAENCAMGHCDYLLKWACGIAEAMSKSFPSERS